MSGTSMFFARRRSRICDTAAALVAVDGNAHGSEPARASAATCATVASMSAVSVLVMDCTTTGASPPTMTPPTVTGTDARRGSGAERIGADIAASTL